jgi:hypothetical protein
MIRKRKSVNIIWEKSRISPSDGNIGLSLIIRRYCFH